MIWRAAAFEQVDEMKLDALSKTKQDSQFELLLETMMECTKSVNEMLKLVAESNGAKFK